MSQKTFKILGITSGRIMGNAEVMLRECLMECEKIAPVEVRITRLRTLKIQECTGCLECLKDAAAGGNGNCVLHDEFEWLKEQILWADAIVLSSPCFCYVPTAEVFTLMNRAMGSGKDYVEACRANPKYIGMIAVGGSDTVDFHLPMQVAAMNAMARGAVLVDQFYANWIRGKGYIAYQENHLARARLQAKRIMNRLMGYPVPQNNVRITKLNPMEYKDDVYVELADCPVCHGAVVEMDENAFADGHFKCCCCGATGHIEHHAGTMTYVWDDDTVAHNLLHADQDKKYIADYAAAHKPAEGPRAEVKRFPVLTPDNDPKPEKPRVLALVAGPEGGASELLACKALEEATADGRYEGAIIRLLDRNVHFCTGCLMCKLKARYRGGVDECILKDEDLWIVSKFIESNACLISVDAVSGFTYGKAVSFMQRFGHGVLTRAQFNRPPRPFGVMISAFDKQVRNATYVTTQLGVFYCNNGPGVAQEYFTNVPTVGDGILADPKSLGRAGGVGRAVRQAADKIAIDPSAAFVLRKYPGMCPTCSLSLIELHQDMTVSCAYCDTHGKFEHVFGQDRIVWDQDSIAHSRRTPYGGFLHFKHIDYSQTDENNAVDNPKIIADKLAPYIEYDKLVKPAR